MSKQIGNASTPANLLKSIAFPSITGNAAFAPIFPNPKTAEPSDKTATEFPLEVYKFTFSGYLEIIFEGSATPGLYAKLNC
ncbi:unnamed protein product [marine sediment metagenome]|uniref:Uncharacterized protein n=1 Tax=marine sediment metagenome TaxID=412755 RepID=X1VW07_9ZZZZ